MNYVPGIGSSTAKLAIVGEAPGKEEDRLGIPFSGATGNLLNTVLSECEVDRNSIYLTNVVKYRPPDNDLSKLSLIGKSVEEGIPQLFEELNSLKPNCIIAMGSLSLETLTEYKGIEHYRGSILQSKIGIKTVPTIHLASLFKGNERRSWSDLTYIKWDIQRAIKESQTPEYNLPRRNLSFATNALQFYHFLEMNRDKKFVSVDIETFRTYPICISFAFSADEAMSVPLFNFKEIQMTQSDRVQVWQDVANLMADPTVFKIGQNFKFDEGQLWECNNLETFFGIKTNSFYFDTNLAFRTLYCELRSRLEFQTSVLTREPYYKEEGKGYNPKKDRFDRLLLYNAKDAAVTFECYERELEELRERGLENFFFERVMPLHPFYRRVERRGMLRDPQVQDYLFQKYSMQVKDLQFELDLLTEELVGYKNVNVNSSGMSGQIGKLVFRDLKVPLRKGTDEKTLDALMRNTVKNPKIKRILELVLEIRKVRKTISTYIIPEAHFDGKIRTAVNIALETGRTSTRSLKVPVTTKPMGIAFQTITKHGDVGSDVRKQFIPDPGYVFIEPDLSQAEDRVVTKLCNDGKSELMYEYKIDKHRVTAGWIFDRCPDALLNEFFQLPSENLAKEINRILKELITDEERQLGKKFRHAANYDMQKREASVNAAISEWRAGQILEKVHATNPKIRQVFHKEIIRCLQENNRCLSNPFGRIRQFLNQWGRDLFKEAFAQIPQSTVSDQVKFAMRRIEKRLPFLQIVEESHDSFLSQAPVSLADKTFPIIKEELETPINFSLCSLGSGELIIPCEIKIGKINWEEMEKVM